MNENWLYVNKIHDHKIIYKFSFGIFIFLFSFVFIRLMVSLQTVVPLSLFSLILLITVCKGSLETTDEGSYDLNIYLDFLLFLLSCDSWGLTVSSHLWTHRSSLSKAVEQELREWFAARRSTFPFFWEQHTVYG